MARAATNAETIISELKGRWHGTHGIARCPAHEDRTPSLSVKEREGKLLLYCHAGCDFSEVVDALRSRGLAKEPRQHHQRQMRRRKSASIKTDYDTRQIARAIWKSAKPIAGTTGERYLQNRGIAIEIPVSIKFDYLKHVPTGLVFPSIVAPIQDSDGKLCAIHRIFLRSDGEGKANVTNPKMSLGPMSGGTVRLGAANDTVALVEGIEDAFAVQQMTGQPAWA